MQLRKPAYFDQFHCIGGACQDNCCLGWAIQVDDAAWSRYQAVPGRLGEKLRRTVVQTEEGRCFQLQNGRCPFLDQENLCELIRQAGEAQLCEICREHPRFYEWLGDWKEAGLGLCCEEAARIIFTQTKPFHLITVPGSLPEPSEPLLNAEWLKPLFCARQRAFERMQDRRHSIYQRLQQLLLFARDIEDCFQLGAPEDLAALMPPRKQQPFAVVPAQEVLSVYTDIFQFYQTLEIEDAHWLGQLRSVQADLSALLPVRPNLLPDAQWSVWYEQMMVYFIYRYFMKAVFDGCLLPRMQSAVLAILLLACMDLHRLHTNGSFTLEDRIWLAKRYAKEIEYSAENTAALCRYCAEQPALAPERISILFPQ